MKMLNGWILEVYLAGRDMTLRVVDATGRAHILRDPFIPVFYVGGDAKELRDLARFLIDQPWDVRLSRTEYKEAGLGHRTVVLQIEVMNPHHFSTIFGRIARDRPKLDYYNGHHSVVQQYFLQRGACPFSFCSFVVDVDDRILGLELVDSRQVTSRAKAARPGNKKRI